jgi:beta-lactamase superfamily II metal-dependent hydrolase
LNIKIRMYRVGFGDFFLLFLPPKDKPTTILIDCGVHTAGVGAVSLKEMINELLSELEDEGVPTIDIVVCTHRHRDHVSGFGYSELWSHVKVKEVWMPWTEDPQDKLGREIRDAQTRRALALSRRLLMLRKQSPNSDDHDMQLSLLAVANNALTNQKAMATLHGGFANTPRYRYLASGDEFKLVQNEHVVVHVLGPSRTAEVIRELDPPRSEHFFWPDFISESELEQILAVEQQDDIQSLIKEQEAEPNKKALAESLRETLIAVAGATGISAEDVDAVQVVISPTQNATADTVTRRRELFQVLPGEPTVTNFLEHNNEMLDPLHEWSLTEQEYDMPGTSHLLLSAEEREALYKSLSSGNELSVTSLDRAINGTSLMLLFEIGNQFLLFPGDAQWGTWKAALDDPVTRELLAKTTFLKVGHHGSHNATPVSFVQTVLSNNVIGMVPTKEGTNRWNIPQYELLENLREHGLFIRSDVADVEDASIFNRTDKFVEVSLQVVSEEIAKPRSQRIHE